MRGPEVSVESVTDSVTGLPDERVFTVVLERKSRLPVARLNLFQWSISELMNLSHLRPIYESMRCGRPLES